MSPQSFDQAVVILPPLEGTALPLDIAARVLAARGIAVLAVVPPRLALPDHPSAEMWAHLLRQRVREARLAIRAARKELRPRCVAVLGISAGALAAVPAAALESEPDAIVLFLGGANLAEIANAGGDPRLPSLAASVAPPVPRSRSLRSAGDVLAPDLRELLDDIEPLHNAASLAPERVLLVRAFFDRVIPRSASKALARAFPGARSIGYPSGHNSFWVFYLDALARASDHVTEQCRRAREASDR